jgi:hypothetical protein
MKFTVLIALVAAVSAQDEEMAAEVDPQEAGDDCSAEDDGGNGPFWCQTTATSCVTYTDSAMASVSTCQDCTEIKLGGNRDVYDAEGEVATFTCLDDKEGAKTLFMSGAALLASIAMMA